MGKDEDWLVEQAMRSGAPLPDRIKNAPELLQGLELYLLAFMELTSCRGLGYGSVGPIPWLAIDRYCEVHRVEGESREDLFYQVQRLDKVYLEWQTDKSKKEAKQSEQRAKNKRG